MKKLSILLTFLLAACAGTAERPASVERMYVIECGENHVKDLSRWTPGVNVGRSHVFGDLHVHGMEGVKFYTRTKVITTRWPHQDTPAPGLHMPTLG